MRPLPSPLLVSLLDDAALFPPGNAPMASAVSAHARHRDSWYGSLVGPFVCPDVRLGELASVLREARCDFGVSVVVTTGQQMISSVMAEGVERGLRLVAIEVSLGDRDGAVGRAQAAVQAIAEQPSDVAGYVEVPRGRERRAVLDVLAGTHVAAKLRTGGLSPEAFPSEAEVASFLVDCATRGISFKCTAGLHRMVRHRAEPEGYERQGVANLLVATAASLAGGTCDELIALLTERDEAGVVSLLEGALRARERFASLGTCGVEEPIADLVRLGVLAPPVAASAASGVAVVGS